MKISGISQSFYFFQHCVSFSRNCCSHQFMVPTRSWSFDMVIWFPLTSEFSPWKIIISHHKILRPFEKKSLDEWVAISCRWASMYWLVYCEFLNYAMTSKTTSSRYGCSRWPHGWYFYDHLYEGAVSNGHIGLVVKGRDNHSQGQ